MVETCCTCIGMGIKINEEEKKEERERGQKSRLSPPWSGLLPLHHTDDVQQHHSATHTVACSSTHSDGPTRASAGTKMPNLHTASTKGGAGAKAGCPIDKTQTNRDRDEMRGDSTERWVGKRGAGPQKLRSSE